MNSIELISGKSAEMEILVLKVCASFLPEKSRVVLRQLCKQLCNYVDDLCRRGPIDELLSLKLHISAMRMITCIEFRRPIQIGAETIARAIFDHRHGGLVSLFLEKYPKIKIHKYAFEVIDKKICDAQTKKVLEAVVKIKGMLRNIDYALAIGCGSEYLLRLLLEKRVPEATAQMLQATILSRHPGLPEVMINYIAKDSISQFEFMYILDAEPTIDIAEKCFRKLSSWSQSQVYELLSVRAQISILSISAQHIYMLSNTPSNRRETESRHISGLYYSADPGNPLHKEIVGKIKSTLGRATVRFVITHPSERVYVNYRYDFIHDGEYIDNEWYIIVTSIFNK